LKSYAKQGFVDDKHFTGPFSQQSEDELQLDWNLVFQD
jgi:hypothetical protein